jgi:hypothetical protein
MLVKEKHNLMLELINEVEDEKCQENIKNIK